MILLKNVKILLASPSDVAEERQLIIRGTENANRILQRVGIRFQILRWEDSPPGAGRPQSVINEDVREYDFAIIVFGRKWGSPTGDGIHTSGTEEELRKALIGFEEGTVGDVAIYFRKYPDGDIAPEILKLREEIISSYQALFRDVSDLQEFEHLHFALLDRWMMKVGIAIADPTGEGASGPAQYEHRNMDAETEELLEKAHFLFRSGEHDQAEAALFKLTIGSRNLSALITLGQQLRHLWIMDRAASVYQSLLKAARELHDEEYEFLALLNLSELHLEQDQHALATEFWNQAQAAPGATVPRNAAHVKFHDAYLLYRNGQFTEALPMLESSVREFAEVGTIEDQMKSELRLAMCLSKFRREAEALEHFLVAERRSVQLQWISYGANVYDARAWLFFNLGKFEEAQIQFQTALAMRYAAGEVEGFAMTIGNLGMMHADSGLSRARYELGLAFILYGSIGDKQSQVLQAGKLAAYELRLGNVALAGYWIRAGQQLLTAETKQAARLVFLTAELRYVSIVSFDFEHFSTLFAAAMQAADASKNLWFIVHVICSSAILQSRIPNPPADQQPDLFGRALDLCHEDPALLDLVKLAREQVSLANPVAQLPTPPTPRPGP